MKFACSCTRRPSLSTELMLGLGYRVRVRVTIRYGRQMSAMVIPRPHHFREGWGRMFCIPSFWSLHHRRRAWINNNAVGGVDQLSAATAAAAAAAARYSCNRRCPAGREQVGRCGGLAGRRLPATTDTGDHGQDARLRHCHVIAAPGNSTHAPAGTCSSHARLSPRNRTTAQFLAADYAVLAQYCIFPRTPRFVKSVPGFP